MAIIIKKQAVDGTVVSMPLQEATGSAPPLPINPLTKAAPEVVEKATVVVNSELSKIAEFKQVPEVKVHNLFAEALAASAEPPPVVLQPWEEDPKYTILIALSEFAAKKFPKKTLRIIHRTNPAQSYLVKEFDPDSGRAKLIGGFKGGMLKPVITERESALYYPVWN